MVRELPAGERPVCRLQRYGPAVLNTAETLSVLLNTPDALALAEELLIRFGGLLGLSRASLAELTSVDGIGPVRAGQLKAALALAQRMAAEAREDDRPAISSPSQAADLVMAEMEAFDQEHLRVLVLDTKNRLTAVEDVYKGNVNMAIVRAAEVLRLAVKVGAPALIVVHNHPSGDPTPSPEDVQVTRTICEAGKLLDIQVLDHLIIGRGKYVSMKERGLI
ncbi:MAG TPA: DNA repair protein RadC [Anaerolineae bacterium]